MMHPLGAAGALNKSLNSIVFVVAANAVYLPDVAGKRCLDQSPLLSIVTRDTFKALGMLFRVALVRSHLHPDALEVEPLGALPTLECHVGNARKIAGLADAEVLIVQ